MYAKDVEAADRIRASSTYAPMLAAAIAVRDQADCRSDMRAEAHAHITELVDALIFAIEEEWGLETGHPTAG